MKKGGNVYIIIYDCHYPSDAIIIDVHFWIIELGRGTY
jgi:hypothetical protein